MNQISYEKIILFLDEQYPALLDDLRESNTLPSWIAEKIESVGKDVDNADFFLRLATELGLSQHLFIKEILEEDFPKDYQRLFSMGILKFELMNIALICDDVFQSTPLTEATEDNRHLRLAVTGVISDYLYQSSIA